MTDVFTQGVLLRRRLFPGVVESRTAEGVQVRAFGVDLKPRTYDALGYKVGVSYNLYDGEELLSASCRAIRSAVAHIVVVYQDTSNVGERREESLAPFLEGLKAEGLIDSIVRYEPDLAKGPAWNEHEKRLIGYRECGQHGCTHHLDMDVDEFYRLPEFERAKRFIFGADIEVSAAPFWYYVKSPRYRLQHCHFFVPFIFKRSRTVGKSLVEDFPCIVDDTRALRSNGRFHMFRFDELAMHHMSSVRKNMGLKVRNSTASVQTNPEFVATLTRVQNDIAAFSFGGHPMPKNFDWMRNQLVQLVEDEFGIGDFGE